MTADAPPVRDRETSRNPLADRLFAYAMAAAETGDWTEAAEVLDQVIERAPNWTAAYIALGDALVKTGNRARAASVLRRALELDPLDLQGAVLRVAAIGTTGVPPSAPAAYVSRLFDDYAPRFEAHLLGSLGYRGPDDLLDALQAAGRVRFDHAIDLGCGTGLGGGVLRPMTARLSGVDLSARMVAATKAKRLYDRVDHGGILDFLAGEPAASADLVFAADVFVYIGDLAPILREAARVLRPDGLIAFTAQRCEHGLCVGPDLRFAHSLPYCRDTLTASGFEPLALYDKRARRENGTDVPGLVALARRP